MTQNPTHSGEYPPPSPRQTLARPSAPAYRTPQTPFADQNDLNATFVLWVLGRWWKIALPFGLVLSGIAAALVLLGHVPKYETTALISIEDQAPYIAFENQMLGNGRRFLQTQIELLRSDIVLGPVVSRPEIASLDELAAERDRIGYLKKNLKIRQIGESELYEISFVSPKAQAAADVANAVLAEYLGLQSSEDTLRSQRVIELLEEERKRQLTNIESMREQVMELAKEATGVDRIDQVTTTEMVTPFAAASSLFQNLTAVDVEREILKAEIQAMRETPALVADHSDDSGRIELEIDTQPAVRERQAVIDQVVAEMENIKTKGVRIDWRKDPAYERLERELDLRKSELANVKNEVRYELSTRQNEQQNHRSQDAIILKERDLARLDARSRLMTEKYEEYCQENKSGGAKTVEYQFARAELNRKESVYELIESRKLALQTEMRAPARVRSRQKANVPLSPMEPVPYKLLLMACAASLAVPFGLAIAHEATTRRVCNVEQLYQHSKARVLGEVARIPVRRVVASPRTLSRGVRRDLTIFAESIDALRTNLAFSHPESMQVLTVCSASAGEGKTTVATSLAASIASATRKPTLIIDADMRSPDVADVLKVNDGPGLAEVLSGECEFGDAIQCITPGNAFVLPAGKATKNPHHLVRFQQVKELLDTLRGKFSTIVIDTGPVLGASESIVFAKAADAVLFCSLSGTSRVRQVQLATERLRQADCNIAGSVLSGKSSNHYAYVYGFYPEQIVPEHSVINAS